MIVSFIFFDKKLVLLSSSKELVLAICSFVSVKSKNGGRKDKPLALNDISNQ